MIDPRDVILANNVASYSLDIQPGEKVMLDFRGSATLGLLREMVTAVTRRGGVPFVLIGDDSIQRRFLREAEEAQVAR